MVVYTVLDVIESKCHTMLLTLLETLFKMIAPTIPEVQGDASRELGRDGVRD